MKYSIEIKQLSNRLYRFIDSSLTACYLAVGDEKAALLDTGDGIGDLKSAVNQITDKPLTVILTHGHLDHIGGLQEFKDADVWLNPNDFVITADNARPENRLRYAQEVHSGLTMDDVVPAYDGVYLPLQDNQIFDLGGLHIQMISVPGHTQGMMCPLLIEERTIIFGDACGVAVMLMDEHSSTISEYLKSLKHLQSYEEQYDTVYRNHGTFTNQKDLLENVMECCQNVLDGTDDHMPFTIHGRNGWMAKKIDRTANKPIDGKEGNLFYILDKIK